jgi:hypothetical protein
MKSDHLGLVALLVLARTFTGAEEVVAMAALRRIKRSQ